MMETKMKLLLSHVFPPIPARGYDYCVHIDGEEEHGAYGWGATPVDAAIAFLTEYHQSYEPAGSPLVNYLRAAKAVIDEPVPEAYKGTDAERHFDERFSRIEADLIEALKILGSR